MAGAAGVPGAGRQLSCPHGLAILASSWAKKRHQSLQSDTLSPYGPSGSPVSDLGGLQEGGSFHL